MNDEVVLNADSDSDPIGSRIPRHILLDCNPSVAIYYDQWAVCILKCRHGSYREEADGLNLTQAYIRAIDLLVASHPRCGVSFKTRGYDLKGEWIVPTETCDLLLNHDGEHDFV